VPTKRRTRKSKSPAVPPNFSEIVEANLASRVVQENLNWAKNLMQLGQPTRLERKALEDYWMALTNAIDPQKMQAARNMLDQLDQNRLIIRQNDVTAYTALYASLLSNIAPSLASLRNQVVHFQSIDLTRFSNDLQIALEGTDAFNFAVKHVSRELKEGEFTAETLERVTPPPTLIEYLREERNEARHRGELLSKARGEAEAEIVTLREERETAQDLDDQRSKALAEAEAEIVTLREKLTIANEKNAQLMNSLDDAERDIQDLGDNLQASKEKPIDEDNPMFR
jgi:chromosome segregation ATPase